MKLKIPPPILAGILAVLMWGISTTNNPMSIESMIITPLSIMAFLVGLAINISAVVSFRLACTTTNPMKPNNATQLVNNGIYQHSRNPMYLGVLFILTAWAIWLENPFNIAVLLFFIWYITKFQIIPEEEALELLFTKEFKSYKQKVRRWI